MDIAFLDRMIEKWLNAVDLQSVFLASVVEKILPILPSYVLFPAIGIGASDAIDLLIRCVFATAGSVAGALVWYALGARIGYRRVELLVERYGSWIFLKPALYQRMVASYRGHSFLITFAGQLIPMVRIFQALPAGVLRLPLLPFLAAATTGTLCWIVPLATAGYFLHREGWSASEVGLGLFLGLLALEALVFGLLIGSRKRRRARPFES